MSVYLYMHCITISSVDPCLINTSKILTPPLLQQKPKQTKARIYKYKTTLKLCDTNVKINLVGINYLKVAVTYKYRKKLSQFLKFILSQFLNVI